MTYILKYTINNMIVVIKRMFGWHFFFLLMKICDSIIMRKIIFVRKSFQFCEWLRIISLLLMILLKTYLSGSLELKWTFKIKTSYTNSSVCWYKLKISTKNAYYYFLYTYLLLWDWYSLCHFFPQSLTALFSICNFIYMICPI